MPTGGSPMYAKTAKTNILHSLYPYLLVLPAVLLVTAVSLYPTLYSFYLSTTRFIQGSMQFVGLRNYRVLLGGAAFLESFRATMIYLAGYVLFTVFFALITALVLNKGLRFTGIYMTVIFLPWVLSEITSGAIWRWMFYRDYGILQNLIGPLFNDVGLIVTPWGAMGIVIAASVWRSVSFGMLLLLAGLQSIPKALIEASQIDGADSWVRFRRVIWPLLFPTMMVTTVFMSIQAINGVGMIMAITKGGPGRATEVLSLYMYREAIQYFNLGYAAAISVVLLGINILFAFFYIRYLRKENALAS